MIRALRNAFNRISTREKYLLVAFLWVVALLWLGSMRKKQADYATRAKTAETALQEQSAWFDESPAIDAGIRDALTRLQAQPSYDGGSLAGRIDTFVRELNLQAEIGAPRTQPGEVFTVHSLKLRIRRATLAQLIAFDARLRGQSPYLNLETISLRPDTADPLYLDAQLSIQSLELKRNF